MLQSLLGARATGKSFSGRGKFDVHQPPSTPGGDWEKASWAEITLGLPVKSIAYRAQRHAGWKEFFMNDKVLIISILSLLGIGILAVFFIAVPWLVNYALPNWKESLLDSGIVIIAVALFVYGFYMNTKMH